MPKKDDRDEKQKEKGEKKNSKLINQFCMVLQIDHFTLFFI